MDEFALIERFFNKQIKDADVVVGIGDDGAVLRPTAGRDLVSVVDTSVADVHFPGSLGPADIGYRAVAVNLSDLAAMGATPRWMLLALTLPVADPDWLSQFSGGLFEAAGEHGVELVGGDTTRGDTLVISVHMLGDVDPGKAIARSGAAPGEQIWLTGATGDAAAGLQLMADPRPANPAADYLIGRFGRPTARVSVGQSIAELATAAIDVSDGLYADLLKMADSSRVRATLELGAVPRSSALLTEFPQQAEMLSLSGGDDYELCFTAPADRAPELASVAARCGVPITRIGEISSGDGIVCRRHGGTVHFEDAGFRHFGKA